MVFQILVTAEMFLKISEHFCLHSTILLEHLLAFEIIHETHKTKLIGMVDTEVKPIDWTHFFPRRESANVAFEEHKPCKLKGTIIQSMIPLINAQMKPTVVSNVTRKSYCYVIFNQTGSFQLEQIRILDK